VLFDKMQLFQQLQRLDLTQLQVTQCVNVARLDMTWTDCRWMIQMCWQTGWTASCSLPHVPLVSWHLRTMRTTSSTARTCRRMPVPTVAYTIQPVSFSAPWRGNGFVMVAAARRAVILSTTWYVLKHLSGVFIGVTRISSVEAGTAAA